MQTNDGSWRGQFLQGFSRKQISWWWDNMIEVVAAIIFNANKFMICQRPPHKKLGLLWEFPGGKVERGESVEEALMRECMEELAIEVSVGELFVEIEYEYPDFSIHLTVLNCIIKRGEPIMLEHNDIKWITTREISQFNF